MSEFDAVSHTDCDRNDEAVSHNELDMTATQGMHAGGDGAISHNESDMTARQWMHAGGDAAVSHNACHGFVT